MARAWRNKSFNVLIGETEYNPRWYRSRDTVLSEHPHSNWLSKKLWPLNEQLNIHILKYQEVNSRIQYPITFTESLGRSDQLGGPLGAAAPVRRGVRHHLFTG